MRYTSDRSSTDPSHASRPRNTQRRASTHRGALKRFHPLFEPLEDRLALTVLPAGFTETLITTGSNLSSPTAMEFSPTQQLWVLEQTGAVKLVRGDGTTHTAITINEDSAGERGVLGITFDPSYDGAGPNADYAYIYYTTPRTSSTDPSNNRLSRFTVTGAGTLTPTLGSELILRDLPPEDEDNNPATNGDTNHNGGALHFGPDGKIYLAVGDHNYDQLPESSDVAQILTSPFGKVLRLNSDGTNPTDNPFYDNNATDWRGSIFALGLRNPYTFAFQQGTGRLFINDVGEGSWEEINDGIAGANYGWAGNAGAVYEGFESPPPPWANYHDPLMAYDHSNSAPTPSGVAITGGVFYPSGGSFGAAYAGKYLFADVGNTFIRIFDPANPGSLATPDTSTGFATALTGAAPVDLKLDLQGNLYYLSRGGATGEIYRISGPNQSVPTLGRALFYNESKFDGNNPAANAADDAAIATNKSAYLPGSGVATFANISSYTRGINGIVIDLKSNHGTLSVGDFAFHVGANNTPSQWALAPAPTSVVVRPGAGVDGADRVEIVWAANAPKNNWLEVTVKGNDLRGDFDLNTGLPSSDVFYFGNRIGDTGTGTASQAITSFVDEQEARSNFGSATVVNDFDFDRTGLVSATDSLAARFNAGALMKISIGNPPAAPQAAPQLIVSDSTDDENAARNFIATALSKQAVGEESRLSIAAQVAIARETSSAAALRTEASILVGARDEALLAASEELAAGNVAWDEALLESLLPSLA